MVPSIDAESSAESILEIVSASALETDTIDVEPASPESTGPETAVAINDATGVVAVAIVDLALNVEIDHSNDTVVVEQSGERIDNWVEFWYHRQSIAHSEKVGSNLHSSVVRVVRVFTLWYDRLGVNCVYLVLFEVEVSSVLANNVDVLPSKPCESSFGDLTKRGGQIDQVDCAEVVVDWEECGHLLNVPTCSSTDLRSLSICRFALQVSFYLRQSTPALPLV